MLQSHIRCRRCGQDSFSVKHSYCVACGFKRTTKFNKNFKKK